MIELCMLEKTFKIIECNGSMTPLYLFTPTLPPHPLNFKHVKEWQHQTNFVTWEV